MSKISSLIVFSMLTAGCFAGLQQPRPDVAKTRATEDFGCQEVIATETESIGARSVYAIAGCGKEATYVVHCDVGRGLCTAYDEAEWKQRESRLHGASMSYSVDNECDKTSYLFNAGNESKASLAPGEHKLFTGVVGDELQLTDDAGTVIYRQVLRDQERTLRVTSSCMTLAE